MYGLCEAAGYELGMARALWQVGCCASDQGHWAQAEGPLRQSLALLEAEQGPDHLDLACVCNGAHCHTLARRDLPLILMHACGVGQRKVIAAAPARTGCCMLGMRWNSGRKDGGLHL